MVRPGLGLFTVGVLAGQTIAPLTTHVPLLAALATLAALLWWLGRGGRGAPVLAGAALLLAGAALGAGRLAAVMRMPAHPEHVARLDLPLRTVLEGVVVEPPEVGRERTALVLEAQAVGDGPARRRARGRVRLAIRRGFSDTTAPTPAVGEEVRVRTTLRRPRGFRNPGAFDTVGHLARHGIWVTAFVWDERTLERMGVQHAAPGGVGLRGWLERWRDQVRASIDAALAAMPEQAGVVRALVVGDRGALAPRLVDAFRRAGVVHVLVVSGLHVGLVGAAALLLGQWLLARSTWLLLRADVRALALALALLPIGAYAALAGFGTSALRATLMAAAAGLALAAGRRAPPESTLALAAVAVALVQPGAPRDAGFQLSFAAVLALVVGMRAGGPVLGSTPARWLRGALRASVWAWLGTAPLVAYHFLSVSLVAPLVNPLVTPLLGGLVVVPALLGACAAPLAPAIARGLFGLAGLLATPGVHLVETIGSLPGVALEVPRPSLLELVLLYGLIAGLAWPRRRAARVLVPLVVVTLALDVGWWVHTRAAPGCLRVTFLDVGQGDAAVAELPDGRVLVIDGGGFPGSRFDPGAAVVRPFLRTRKILRVDALVMTHPHPDHAVGLASLVDSAWAGELWWNGTPGRGRWWDALEVARSGAALPRRRIRTGSVLPGRDGAVRVLHPPPGWPARSLNDGSLTLALRHGSLTVLLTGDVEAPAEAAMLAARRLGPAAVLKVPHHGSRTSSTSGFVERVAPAIAVMSVGPDNRYGLPAREVEARYRAAGSCVLRTDRCGAVTVETDGRRLAVWTAAGCACDAPGSGARLRPPA